MDEKPIENGEHEEAVAKKKVYTPPALSAYGKLTQLTAGGSGGDGEPNPDTGNQPPYKHP